MQASRQERAGLGACEGVVTEIDVRRFVHAAVVDLTVGKLHSGGLNTYAVNVDAVGRISALLNGHYRARHHLDGRMA